MIDEQAEYLEGHSCVNHISFLGKRYKLKVHMQHYGCERSILHCRVKCKLEKVVGNLWS